MASKNDRWFLVFIASVSCFFIVTVSAQKVSTAAKTSTKKPLITTTAGKVTTSVKATATDSPNITSTKQKPASTSGPVKPKPQSTTAKSGPTTKEIITTVADGTTVPGRHGRSNETNPAGDVSMQALAAYSISAFSMSAACFVGIVAVIVITCVLYCKTKQHLQTIQYAQDNKPSAEGTVAMPAPGGAGGKVYGQPKKMQEFTAREMELMRGPGKPARRVDPNATEVCSAFEPVKPAGEPQRDRKPYAKPPPWEPGGHPGKPGFVFASGVDDMVGGGQQQQMQHHHRDKPKTKPSPAKLPKPATLKRGFSQSYDHL